MKHLKKLSLALALLIATAASAGVVNFSTEAYTTNATLTQVSVTSNTTLTINKGITVTVNNGLTIANGATLYVTGGGTLEVNGKNGANGQNAWFETNGPDEISHQATPGGDGTVAISGMGNLYVKNAIIIANGGNGGLGGDGDEGWDIYAASGGNGANAITGVSVIFEEGMLTAIGGGGGLGGNYYGRAITGSDATGFASFPAIAGATLSYSDNGTDYTKYPSGNTSLHKYMKVEPKTVEVIINDAKSEASFEMLKYDVTATYTIKRDMSVDVACEMADRIRIEMVDNKYQAVDATLLIPVVKDNLDQANPVTMSANTDYTLQLQKQSDSNAEQWSDVAADNLSVGNFRYKITGAGNYSGVCYSEEFRLFKGYPLEIAAGEYATFYMNEVLKVDESTADGQLYTITNVDIEGGTATASDVSVADSETPLLVKNNASETKTILLVPTTDAADEVTVADEFKGTLIDKTITDEDMYDYDYYVCTGSAFVWVKDTGIIPANRAWLQIPTANAAGARTLQIVFGDETTGVDAIRTTGSGDWYDLNGRKLPAAPTRKGVYILNGKKVVVK